MRSTTTLLTMILATSAWAAPEKMQGVQVGAGGTLTVREMPVPRPGGGEVLVKVRAAGVNPVDWKAAGSRVGQVPGADVSGVIDTLGEGVTGWKVGEPVLGVARQSGSYAEYAVIPVAALAHKPRSLSFEEAAGVPIAAETAYRSLHEAGGIKAGQVVLIHGAAGGVGSAAVQIAKAAGARVIGTASAGNADFVKSIGVDQFIDYNAQEFEHAVKDVDLVLNTANAETTARSIAIVRPGGTLVTIVGSPDAAACEAAKIRCARPDRSVGPSSAELLERVNELAEAGKFKVFVEQVYPMSEAAQAWQKSRAGHTRGKLIIQVSAGPTMTHQADSPLAAAAKKLGLENLQSLEFEASGRYYQFGQAPAPELGWPPFTVDGYLATLDFARGAVHAKYHRVQVQEPGRARPFSEQTMDQYSANGVSWNLVPGPVAMPGNLAERNAELVAWSPQGFVRAALASHASTERSAQGWRAVFNVGAYRFEGDFDQGGDLLRVRSAMDAPVLGDTPIEFSYADYQSFGGLRFPRTLRRMVAGRPWYELTVSAVRTNTAQALAVPPEVAANPVPSVANIEVTELAPGLLLFGGGTHNSVIVQQHDGIVVIEAPLSEQRSEAVIAKVHALFPGRPIAGVINTHAHFDHAGGLRTYVDEGVPVITQSRNANYYAAAWRAPHTLNPDRLSKSQRAPAFRTFGGRMTLADEAHPIEIHEIQGSGHNDAFAMIYLPKDRVLVEADAWTPTPPGAAAPASVNPLWRNLYQNIQRLQIDVQTVAPLHGTPRPLEQLRIAVGADAS